MFAEQFGRTWNYFTLTTQTTYDAIKFFDKLLMMSMGAMPCDW